MEFPPEVLNQTADSCALGVPADEARAEFVVDGEEAEVTAELAVVPLGGLLKAVEVGVEGLLGLEGGAVNSLEHGPVFVASPVGARDAEELEGGHLASGLYVGAIAEIREFTVGVDAEGVILDGIDDFELEGLVLEKTDWPPAGAAWVRWKGRSAAMVSAIFLLDGGEVIVGEGAGELEVVVEAVLGGGADGELDLGEDGLDGLGHDVRGRVSDGLSAEGEGIVFGRAFTGL